MGTHVRLTLAMLAAALAVAVAVPASAQDCEESAANMAQVRSCVEAGSDARLAAEVVKTMQVVRQRAPALVPAFQRAQEAWAGHARSACDFSVAAEQVAQLETAMPGDARLACQQDQASGRVEQLRRYQRMLSGGQ